MLWMLRHADAAAGSPDDMRPLTERGMLQATYAGRAIARLGANIDLCLTSPRLRARQTADLACEPLGVEVQTHPWLAGGPFDALELVAGLGDVLLVGHEPSMSITLHDLTGVHARLRKGGLAGLDRGELLVLMRPSELSAIAAAWEPVA